MAEPEQQMHQLEFSCDPVLDNMRDKEIEELQTASKDELPSEDLSAREHANERKILVSLFGYELNWDEKLALRVTWYSAFGLAGLALHAVLFWQFLFLGLEDDRWMISSFLLALASFWLLGAHFIFSFPSEGKKMKTKPPTKKTQVLNPFNNNNNKEVSTAYRLHKLLFISTNLFLFFVNIFLFFLDIVEDQRYIVKIPSMRSEWIESEDKSYWYDCMTVKPIKKVENFVPWFIWPLLVTTVIFTAHHLKEHNMV